MQSGQVKAWRILVTAGAASLAVIYILLWARMIVDPAQRTGTDFIAFFAAGRSVQEHGFSRAYDVTLQQRIEQDEVGFPLGTGQVMIYIHVPYLLPLLDALVNHDYAASFIRWVVVLMWVYAGGLAVLAHWFPADTPIPQKRVFILGAAFFFPFFVSLLLGQDTALLFLGAALLGWGVNRQENWLAGTGLALMTVRPHFLPLIALPFFFSRRGVFWWFLALAGFLAAISVGLLGIQGTRDFMSILMTSAGGKWYGTNESAMYNMIGLLSRLLPFLDPSVVRAIGWTAYLAAIAGLCILARRAGRIDLRLLTLMLLVSVLAVPHFHYHDLALLVFPLLIFQQESGAPAWLRYALQPLSGSFLLLLGSSLKGIGFIVPYLIVFLLVSMQVRREAHRLQLDSAAPSWRSGPG